MGVKTPSEAKNSVYIRYFKNTLTKEGIFYFFDKTKGKMMIIET